MNRALGNDETPQKTVRRSPMWQLVLARLREFIREPEAVFWVCGFPVVMVMALGIAFRNRPIETITVDIVDNGPAAEWGAKAFVEQERFEVSKDSEEAARNRL